MSSKLFGKVAVLMGGTSAERDVSFMSGRAVLQALQSQGVDAHEVDLTPQNIQQITPKNYDRAFIVLHGPWGEDGIVQGALESVAMPYTGTGVLGCALAMDKVRCKHIWSAHNLPTAPYRAVQNIEELKGVVDYLGLPLFVKPACEGSSVGISKVFAEEELEAAWREAAKYGDVVLCEKFIDGDELFVAVLGEETLPSVRMQTPNEFYDYDAKYLRDDTQYFCPSGISTALESELARIARHAFAAIAGSGWGRLDFIIDSEQKPFLLEANTIPGMTDHSLVPMSAAARGIDFRQLVLRILETSL